MWTLQSSPAIEQNSGGARYSVYRLLGAISDGSWDALTSNSTLTVSELGIGAMLANLISEDYEPVHGDRTFPDLYAHAQELYEEEGYGGEPVRILLSQRSRLGVMDRKGTLRWGDPSAPVVLGHVPVLRRPAPELRMTRDQFEQRLRRLGAQICLGTQPICKVSIGLPKDLYYLEEFDGQVKQASQMMAYDDLPEETKAAIWESARNFALGPGPITHRIGDVGAGANTGAQPKP
jgi:hypothetical protein